MMITQFSTKGKDISNIDMDIAPQLFDNPEGPSLDSPTELGWDETESAKVSEQTAGDIVDVVESRTKKLTKNLSLENSTNAEEGESSNTPEDYSRQIDVISHSDLRLGSLIGEGGFNQIFSIRSFHEDDGDDDPEENDCTEAKAMKEGAAHKYVVKVLKKNVTDNEVNFALQATDLVKEALLMAALDHKNILRIKAISEGGVANFELGRRSDAFFMVLDRLNGSLHDCIHKNWKAEFRRLQSRPKDRASFFYVRLQVAADIADGLAHMHSKCIIHRDIKPQNIGFDQEKVVKIFDFGLARIVPDSNDPDETFQMTKKSGTQRYISPENYQGLPYNLKSDVYSFGVLLHEILSLELPFVHTESREFRKPVMDEKDRPRIPFCWSRPIRKLLQKAWAHKSEKRPTMERMHHKIRKAIE